MRLVSQMFPGKFLHASDIVDDALFTIESVDQETFTKNDGTKEKKLVVTFQETTRKLSLNVINRSTLVSLFGDDIDAWPGHAVVLFSATVQGPTGMTEGIRIKSAARKPSRSSQAADVRYKPLAGSTRFPAAPPVESEPDEGESEDPGF